MRVVFAALVAAMVAVHEPTTIDDVDAAIRWLTRSAPKSNPMQLYPLERMQMAIAIYYAAEDWDLNPYLLVVMAYHESSFKKHVRGDLGEVGIFQMHGPPLRRCIEDDFDMEAPYDQA